MVSHCGILRRSSCLSAASPGPAPPASQRPLSAQPSSCLLAAFPSPAFDFRWPLQASTRPSLLPPEGLHRPSLCLTADSPRPASCRLTAASRVQSSCLSAASTGPAPACQWPLQAHGAHSSQRPFQAQFFPSGGLSGPRTSSRRPPQAQVVLESASPGPASQQVSKLFWLNSCPAPNRLCRPRTFSSQALRAHLLPPGGLYRPSTGWRTASAGPALASQGPLQGPWSSLVGASSCSHGGLWGPSPCLPPSSPRAAQLLPHGGLLMPNSCLWHPAQRREPLPHTGPSHVERGQREPLASHRPLPRGQRSA
ncbi:putative uncharacterized protein FLJ46235 [Pan troglodytes]|uniref:putative uncharacterized protein FLJ46235 n=1 Tax=Pan troglodytes TaxID=9598 RepID=UPI0023F2034E|nr:putative uncharacterized protein FLJ46235 [Pan troglodytes]